MTTELAIHLVRSLITRHPLPWHVEEDWAAEVIDAGGGTVLKVPSQRVAIARELVAFATELGEADACAEAEARAFLRELDINLDAG